MTTLHALRRTYALSFSELAVLTAVPVRRLAEFEYHGLPLSSDERQSLASFFGVADQTLEGGFLPRRPTQHTLTQAQAQALAMLAATAALAWSLRIGHPIKLRTFGGPSLPVANAAAPVAQEPTPTPTIAATEVPTATHEPTATATTTPTATSEPTATATTVPAATQAPTATATAVPTATQAPSATATALPTATQAPTVVPTATQVPAVAAEPTPTSTKRIFSAFRLKVKPTPTPRPAKVKPQAAQAPTLHIQTTSGGTPHRCPVVPVRGRPVITQGYGVGTHSPAEIWGALDLGVAGGPTAGAPVIATHSGYVQVTLDSWPGGNFVSISSDEGWRTGYAHLDTVLVSSGQYVDAGTPIGTVGSTGMTTGPHLHYETWHNGVNVDPSPVLSCN